MMWTFVIFVLAMFALLVYFMTKATNAQTEKVNQSLQAVGGFTPAVTSSLGLGKQQLSIDPVNNKFAVINPGQSPKVFNFDQVVAVEVGRNGSSLTKTNRGSQAAGAAVGAVLLGPAGLLLGGLSGSKRTEDTVKSLSLKIYTNDLVSPVTEVFFFKEFTAVKEDSFAVKAAAKQLDEWYGRFQTILHMRKAA